MLSKSNHTFGSICYCIEDVHIVGNRVQLGGGLKAPRRVVCRVGLELQSINLVAELKSKGATLI